MSARPRRAGRLVSAIALVLGGAGLAASGACTQQATQVAVRSLERSGRASFVCLAAPGTKPTIALPLDKCTGTIASTTTDFGQLDDGTTTIPHLYALITQTTRGEVALVDTTASTGNIVDEDPGVPGANFLPIGAQPTDIASTPGGVATFVGVAEIGREAIFALPSTAVRPNERTTEPTLSSWPACRLPAAPGEMLVVVDPEKNGAVRATCDGDYTSALPALKNPAHGDLSTEGPGRQKLVVMLPDLGGFAVIDAQSVLDLDAGSFDPCPIERWVPLTVDLPAPEGSTPAAPTSGACVQPAIAAPAVVPSAKPRPSGVAVASSRMYVGDLAAPVVHVIDLPTPCEPHERPPLLPADARDPSRVVVTSHVATTPNPTGDLKRFVYAVDVEDASTMVFDVSEDATSRRPLERQHPEWNPFQPVDRIKYGAPPQDLLVFTRDVPVTNPATGTASAGLRCDPTDGAALCPTSLKPPAQCDLGTLYRTSGCIDETARAAAEKKATANGSSDAAVPTNSCTYTGGAGPNMLRGTFAFVLLSSGQIGVVDVDDFDAPCRVPSDLSEAAGCGERKGKGLASTQEVSCNVVEPNAPRSSQYAVANDAVGHRAPGVSSQPLLYDKNGSLVPNDSIYRKVSGQGTEKKISSSPFMVATLPASGGLAPELAVGVKLEQFDESGFGVSQREPKDKGGVDEPQLRYGLVMNAEDPRVHVADQNWYVSWEGAVADYSKRLTNLRLAAGGSKDDGLYDPNGRYCDAGVHSEAAVRAALVANGTPEKDVDAQAAARADYVQITSPVPPQNDPYWSALPATCESASFATCNGLFGTPDVPRPERDLRIVEAYQDRLLLALRRAETGLTTDEIKCCFPSDVTFYLRGGSQWVVLGDQSGFLHHVIADPATGACRDSCDPKLARLNGRALLADAAPVTDGADAAFVNPMFRFAIVRGGDGKDPTRDMNFRFTTQGAFQPLIVDLASTTKDVQPQSLRFLAGTGEIAVVDGSLNGLYLVSAQSVQVSRQFY